MSSPADIITFGCRLNAYESEVMRMHAKAAGLDDAIIVNTCTVTAEATRQAKQTIRKLRREQPMARIIVTGCAAQVDPQSFAAMDEVDAVLGNTEKLQPESFRNLSAGTGARVQVNDIMSVRETAAHLITGFEGRARAFVQVQNGCDHRCTFCIIPFGRGNARSVPIETVTTQIKMLVDNGTQEIVLTGVDLTAYGADLPAQPSLGTLTTQLLESVPGLLRLRLSSLDPVEVDASLMELIRHEPRLMPHLHLSLQSGDDLILKRMKRRHRRADAIAFCHEVLTARPEILIGADLIAGFPTETEEMFENTLSLVDECGLTFLHVFPYSARAGTPAARMPQVPGNIVRERASVLRNAGAEALRAHLANHIGRLESVLVEKPGFGRAENYAPVSFTEPMEAGHIVQMTINDADAQRLYA